MPSAPERTPATLQAEAFTGPLAARLADPAAAARPHEAVLYWLGQAGFVVDYAGWRLLIDPYLSDTLAEKYRGTRFPHRRMMPSPLAVEELDRVDLVLCTHRHTDHMDPGTLQPLARRFPRLCFVVPAAELAEAGRRCGVGPERLVPVDAGRPAQPLPGCRVVPLPAAHETLETDAQGRHHWLGYVLRLGRGSRRLALYHSGDCVPYRGQAALVARQRPDLALLPVNGRDEERRTHGVPGNFTLEEAVQLCRQAGVPQLIGHHYGLFDFNTIDPAAIDRRARQAGPDEPLLQRARQGLAWRLARVV